MNNRIRELEPQCWEMNEFGLNFDYKKFAELLLFECIKIAVFRGDPATGKAIKEHFEV